MTRTAALALLACAHSAPAQEPPEAVTRFDPRAAELKWDGGNWQVWAGETLLRDFGPQYDAANEALRAIRELNLDSFAAVGQGRPAFEYWLAGGQAPPPPSGRRQTLPFATEKLQVSPAGSVWCLIDDRQVLFTFPERAQAERAAEVCRRHGFNEVVYVGSPEPKMVYLVRNEHPAWPAGRPRLREQLLQAQAGAGGDPGRAVTLGELGYVGDRTPVRPRDVRAYRDGTGWAVGDGRSVQARFADERPARTLERMLSDTRVTDVVRLADFPLLVLMDGGRLSRGLPLGVEAARFSARNLRLAEEAGEWAVEEPGPGGRGRTLLRAGPDRRRAERLLAILQYRERGPGSSDSFDCLVTLSDPLRGEPAHVLAQEW